jgi:MEDS: MEthanogen/methylotroph, DcmR Sensory domain
MDQAMNNGYRVIRLLGFIGWDQPGWPDTASIVEFERRVNAVVRAYPAVVVCTYDLPNLGGLSVMEGGLRNHPIMIMGTRIVRDNPFYLAA